MEAKKRETITRSIKDYKKLSKEDKMFVLGYMQGVLRRQDAEKMQETG